MNSFLTDDFIELFSSLPQSVKAQARRAHRLWVDNPYHRSLQFKRVGINNPVYSVRIGIGWRALGLRNGNDVHWFWIGSHAEYDKIVSIF